LPQLRRYLIAAPPALPYCRASGATLLPRFRRYLIAAPPPLPYCRTAAATLLPHRRRSDGCRNQHDSGAMIFRSQPREKNATLLKKQKIYSCDPPLMYKTALPNSYSESFQRKLDVSSYSAHGFRRRL
jgi:hypothetical protein